MITPKDLKEKAEKMFFRVVSAEFRGESIFPLTIPSNKRIAGSNFSDYSKDLVPLHEHSKEFKGKGYSVEWSEKSINGIKQTIPNRIYFEKLEDLLSFIHKERDYENIRLSRQQIIDSFPVLENWVNDNPSLLLKHTQQWNDILKVCKYLMMHDPPYPYFIRELPIEVHSKFIEQNSGILKLMLDKLLDSSKVNYAQNDFAGRYYLKSIGPYTQIRVLDEQLKPYLGYDQCTLPIDDAAWLSWLPENVFIIENQICYVTFPLHSKSVAIFGEGFKSRLTKNIPWLNKTQIYCWFDLDAAGFEMLSMIRQHYPNAKSFLMDNETYHAFENFSVENNNVRTKDLPFLTDNERSLYAFLSSNKRRLEQERISQEYVKLMISKL